MKMTALGIVLSMLLLPLTVVSQATITSPAIPYTQDFVFLTTGTLTLVNNVTSPGWYSFRTNGDVPGGNIFGADDGSDFVGGFNNYGSTGSSDRRSRFACHPSHKYRHRDDVLRLANL